MEKLARRVFKYWILFAVVVMAGCEPAKDKQDKASQKPNIVLIISDDQGWTDYGFMGHEYIETPRIDRLAEEGLTFTYGYSTAPLCSPALASMATGLYPHQHGIIGNDPVFDFDGNRYSKEWNVDRMNIYKSYISDVKQIETIADFLKPLGYTSYQAGK